MVLIHSPDRDRMVAKLLRQRLRRIPDDRQAAAAFRSVRGEGRDDDVAAWLHGRGQALEVRGTISRFGEEMEHGAIVPDVDGSGRPRSSDVRLEPAGSRRVAADARLRAIERSTRQVKDGDAGQAPRQKMIDEAGIPASNVEQSRPRAGACGLDQLERRRGGGLKPADAFARARRILGVPVTFPFLLVRHRVRSQAT